jgi:hypothetical protein
MIRFAIAIVAVSGLSAGLALGDPPAEKPAPEAKADKKAEKKADQPESKAKKQPGKQPGKQDDEKPDLRVAEPQGLGSINLFPGAVLGHGRRSPEKERRLTLGDDGDWKVQAAQVGAMAAVFGALVGLCGGGKCLIPGEAVDFLPDWMTAEDPVYHSPRRDQPIRQAR